MKLGAAVIDTSPLRDSPAFRRVYIARGVTLLDGGMIAVAVTVQVYEMTDSPLQVSFIGLTLAAAMVIGALVGGVLVDEVDRKKLLMAAGFGTSATFGAMALNGFAEDPKLWVIHACAVVAGLVFGVDEAALMAVTPALVPADKLTAANALTSVIHQFGGVIGPSLAGIIIAADGVGTVYLVSAVTGALSALLLIGLPALGRVSEDDEDDEDETGLQAALEGFRFIRKDQVIAGILLIDVAAVAFAMPFALFPAHAEQNVGGDAAAAGYFYTFLALGALLATLLSGWLGTFQRTGLLIVGTSLVWGLSMAGFGLTHSMPVALALMLVAGAADSTSETVRRSLLQHRTPEHLQGRVGSLWLAQSIVMPSAGNVGAGVIANSVGVRAAITAGGVICAAGAAIVDVACPQLRKASLQTPSADEELTRVG